MGPWGVSHWPRGNYLKVESVVSNAEEAGSSRVAGHVQDLQAQEKSGE